MNKQDLVNGVVFSVSKSAPNIVEEGKSDGATYYATVMLEDTNSQNRLSIRIWDTEAQSLVRFNGTDYFVFSIDPPYEDGEQRGHRYVLTDPINEDFKNDVLRSYNGAPMYQTIKNLIVDILIVAKRI